MVRIRGLIVPRSLYGRISKPVIDNERVTVWDVTGTKGQTNPARGHDRDAVVDAVDGRQRRDCHALVAKERAQ